MQKLNLSKQKFLLKIQKLNLKMLKLKKPRKYLRKFSWIAAQKKALTTESLLLQDNIFSLNSLKYQNKNVDKQLMVNVGKLNRCVSYHISLLIFVVFIDPFVKEGFNF